jgi:hypothetical protein
MSRYALEASTTPSRAAIRYWRQRRDHPVVAHLCLAPVQPSATVDLVREAYRQLFAWLPDGLVDGSTGRPILFDALDTGIARAAAVQPCEGDAPAVEGLLAALEVAAHHLEQIRVQSDEGATWTAQDGVPLLHWLYRQPSRAIRSLRVSAIVACGQHWPIVVGILNTSPLATGLLNDERNSSSALLALDRHPSLHALRDQAAALPAQPTRYRALPARDNAGGEL